MSTEENQPWNVLPGESAKAYKAFRTYMLLGKERSLRRATDELGLKGISNLGNWSAEFNWAERVAAYDSHIVSAEVDGYAQEMAGVRSYHLEVTQRLLIHLDANMRMWKPGQDPSIRWTQAFTVALKSQQQALQMRQETDKPNALVEQIMTFLRTIEGVSE